MLGRGFGALVCVLLSFAAFGKQPQATETYTLSFASFAPMNTDVFIADGDGNNARPLFAHSDLDYDAVFAPNGDWIYFTSRRDGSADIYRGRMDGSALQRVIDDPAYDDQAAISPDGRQLAFVSTRSGQADIWILDLESKALRNVTEHAAGDFRPSWSPDGKWLAFSSDRDSKKPRGRSGFTINHSTEIYVMRVADKSVRRLTSLDEVSGSPRWSPDGRKIVFSHATFEEYFKITTPQRALGTSHIKSVDVATGEIVTLTELPGEKRSPQFIATDRVGYFTEGTESGLDFVEAARGASGEFRNPSWSSDGKHLLFHRDVQPHWPPHRRWHSLDPRFQLIRTGVFSSWSPDGRRMISNDQTAGILHNSILSMDADGSQRLTIFTHPEDSALAPVWANSGDRIAFALGQFFQSIKGPARADIATIRADGSGLRILTDGKSNYGFPSWSGDGKQLVFREVIKGKNTLHVLDLASGQRRVLIEGPSHLNFPSWSPTADLIAFTGNMDGDYEIYTIKPDGTDLKRLTDSPGNDAHSAWSRDGQWIAFSSGRTGFKDEGSMYKTNPQSYGELYVMRADGSDQHPLTDDQFEEATPAFRP
jgi:Tol biopolymer transport system component